MANTALAVDWGAIRQEWCNGATSDALGALHGISPSSIRSRAVRHKWGVKRPGAIQSIAQKATQKLVKQAVTRLERRVSEEVENGVDACIAKSIGLGKQLMQRAERSIEEAEDGSLGSVASVARTGVDIWRKSLGLDATGAGSVSCAIQFNFVARGSESFPDATACNASATPDAVDI